jgi:PBP1b-binding outer membrane lipoprotein LpoB
MKVLFSIVLLSLVLWGCSKKNDLTPKISNQTKQLIDTTKKLTRDDSIHLVAFIIDPQKVKTSVSGKTLVLAFDESVNLFLFAEAYKITSAIHLKEDLKKTSLGAFDFTTLNQDGQTTFNFVDDNLNNVKFKSISDTTINHIKVVKINVHRLLTFSKEYGSNQLATDQQNLLLGKTNNQLTFSSYTYYNQKNYPVTSAVAFLQYVK